MSWTPSCQYYYETQLHCHGMKLEGQKREIFCSCNILKHLNIPFAALEGNAPYLFFLSAKKQNRVTAFLGRNYSLFPTHTVLSLDELLHVFLCSIVQTSKSKIPNVQYEQRKAIGNIENNPKRRGGMPRMLEINAPPHLCPTLNKIVWGAGQVCWGGVWPCLCLSAVSDLRQGRPWPALGYCVAAWGPGKA